MKTKIAMALIINACVVSPTIAGDIYRWTDPETGKVVTTPSVPPYPIKEKRTAGGLPNGELVNVILDAGSPEVKAAIEKRKAKEAEEKRISEERQAKEAEQKQIAEEKEKEQAQKNNKKNNTFPSEEPKKGKKRERIDNNPSESLINVCLDQYRSLLKDPRSPYVQSAWIDRVTNLERPDVEPWTEIVLDARAKNSFGGYIAKAFVCPLTDDGNVDKNQIKGFLAAFQVGIDMSSQ